MYFTLYNIAKHPEVQQKLYEEIQAEAENGNEFQTLGELSRLRYLDMVIKESLRLYPPAPYYGRKITEEITIGDYTFPKDCAVFLSPYLMGRDPKLFSDPLKFKPERFNGTGDKINSYAYIPFAAGPRSCIGQKYAVCEAKIAITNILRNFELSVPKESEKLECILSILLKTQNGIAADLFAFLAKTKTHVDRKIANGRDVKKSQRGKPNFTTPCLRLQLLSRSYQFNRKFPVCYR